MHYCPVKTQRGGRFALVSPGNNLLMQGYTISFSNSFFGILADSAARRWVHELWTHHLRPIDRTASSTRFRPGCRTLPRGPSGAIFFLHGSTAVHGLRAA